jgi:hypothetical protein
MKFGRRYKCNKCGFIIISPGFQGRCDCGGFMRRIGVNEIILHTKNEKMNI